MEKSEEDDDLELLVDQWKGHDKHDEAESFGAVESGGHYLL